MICVSLTYLAFCSPLFLSTSSTLTSFIFLELAKHTFTSRPLHQLFLLFQFLFPKYLNVSLSPPSGLSSKVSFPRRSIPNTLVKITTRDLTLLTLLTLFYCPITFLLIFFCASLLTECQFHESGNFVYFITYVLMDPHYTEQYLALNR